MSQHVQAAPSGRTYQRLIDTSDTPGLYESLEAYEYEPGEWHVVGYWTEDDEHGFDFLSVTRTEAEAEQDLATAQRNNQPQGGERHD